MPNRSLFGHNAECLNIEHTWDIFSKNDIAIQEDFDLLTKQRKSQPISTSNNVIAPENIFIEEGAKVEASILNSTSGPIYIGKNAEVMEGSIVRGGFALCAVGVHSMVGLGIIIVGCMCRLVPSRYLFGSPLSVPTVTACFTITET